MVSLSVVVAGAADIGVQRQLALCILLLLQQLLVQPLLENGADALIAGRADRQRRLTSLLQPLPAVSPAQVEQPKAGAVAVLGMRAMLGAPELILADEPTSALDEETKASFVDLLRGECAAAGAGLPFVSHDRGLEPHFDRVVEFTDLNRGGQ
jgi:predicted ABC-type transport system involved in lysophospholipase L1 biosynthesis ATPase subunit